MQALVKTQKGVGFLELREVPEPVPGPGEVLIEVQACGICGTDVHVKHDNFPYWPPVILGHEFSGEVVQLGPDTTGLELGARVVGEPHTQHCGHCYLCRTGNIQICASKRSPGWGIDGAFAKYLKMPVKLLHRIPDSMSYDEAAVVEPTANVVTDLIERTGVTAGDFVVVMGPGPIGLLAALAARAAGARHVVIVGTPADEAVRLAKARELGIDTVLNVAEADPREVVADLTDGLGADVVAECSGAAPAIATGIDVLRKMGKFCAIGLAGKDKLEFPWDKAQGKVCTITFNMSTQYTSWDRAIALIATGKIPVGQIISHREPLANWEHVFEEIESQRALKALLIP
ncbi:MAG TPA: alcohol dehydrogenase catalytic domain-containing protein [Armatimonadota bacterium]|jgi:L-iditol 2-dehydrogenase